MICPSCGAYTEGPFDPCCRDREAEYEQGDGQDPGLWETIAQTTPATQED